MPPARIGVAPATFSTEMQGPAGVSEPAPFEPSVAPPFPAQGEIIPDMWTTVLGLRMTCCGKSMGVQNTKRMVMGMAMLLVLLFVAVIVLSVRATSAPIQMVALGAAVAGCAHNPPPCLHGGTCTEDTAGAFMCACPPGYVGITCEVDIDACLSHPCTNGATCVDGVEVYHCDCAAGFAGVHCEFNVVDECDSQPCKNDGVCTDLHTQYYCQCEVGFTGDNCELDVCSSGPCQHGGSCVGEVGRYGCDCIEGYAGRDCEKHVNPCEHDEHDCDSSHVECIHTGEGTHRCQCHEGYETADAGHTCTEKDECLHNPSPCHHGGTCTDVVGGFTCACAAGYYGDKCHLNLDDCSSNPCENGATCIDSVDAYRCECALGYAGTECEVNLINECGSQPCLNGGTCADQVGGYVCFCTVTWIGEHCQDGSDLGFGSGLDMANPFTSDGSFNLKFAPIFAGQSRNTVAMDVSHESATIVSSVWPNVAAMLQAEAAELGVSYQAGMFSADRWLASLRQDSYSSQPQSVLGMSSVEFTISSRSFGDHLPLDPEFAHDVDALPTTLSSTEFINEYFKFLGHYGTHYVARETFGGQVNVRFSISAVYGTHFEELKTIVHNRLQSALDSGQMTEFDRRDSSDAIITSNQTITLNDYAVQVIGGNADASNPKVSLTWDKWTESVEKDPELIGLELHSIADLIPDISRRTLMAQAANLYFGRCNGDTSCSNRGLCNLLLATCLCDVGYYGSDCELATCPTRSSNATCSSHGRCHTDTGRCACDDGFTGDSCGFDQDECQELDNACRQRHVICRNSEGSYQCGDMCADGYTATDSADAGVTRCEDVDECADVNNGCTALQTSCHNLDGSYECGGCDTGMTPTGRYTSGALICTDIDECSAEYSDTNRCIAQHRVCENKHAAYSCGACLDGFADSEGVCTDVDECQAAADSCGAHSTCTNTIGGFACHCEPGYEPAAQGGGGDDDSTGDSVCIATECTNMEASQIDHANELDCHGATGDTCEFECADEFYGTGVHTCGPDGFFVGGHCTLECARIRVNGDCVSMANGEYSLDQNWVNNKPHYTNADGLHLYWSTERHGRQDHGEWIIDDNTETESLHSFWESSSETPSGTGAWIMWCQSFWIESEVTLTCLGVCDNTCKTKSDGTCDDGGPEAPNAECIYGSDCDDCGTRGAPADGGNTDPDCTENVDVHGRSCAEYVTHGYNCELLVFMYGMDCHCTC